jgi:hypothetical protein
VSGLRRDEAASSAQAGVRCQGKETKELKPETSTKALNLYRQGLCTLTHLILDLKAQNLPVKNTYTSI